MIDIKYEELVTKINSFEIEEVVFTIVDYVHYRQSIIQTIYDSLPNGNKLRRIHIELTPDKSECVSFLNEFKENSKLFKMEKNNTYTLKQLFEQKRVEIVNIKYRV